MTHRLHPDGGATLRPSHVCARLLAALDGSDGRRRSRKRDTKPDSIGLAIKRRLLEGVVADDPDAYAFESWLIDACDRPDLVPDGAQCVSTGAIRAMALDVLSEWRMALQVPDFRSWLEQGAPSADAR